MLPKVAHLMLWVMLGLALGSIYVEMLWVAVIPALVIAVALAAADFVHVRRATVRRHHRRRSLDTHRR